MLTEKTHNDISYQIYSGRWTRDEVQRDSRRLYVFGDNDQRVGNGGQAVIRHLPNSIGLRTKSAPGIEPGDYWTDDDFARNCIHFEQDITYIFRHAYAYNLEIVLSEGGYGTGLAYLSENAPKTFAYVSRRLNQLFGFDNWYALSVDK